MKKLILIPIIFLSYLVQAQYIVVKPSQLPAASTINPTDLFILNQGTTTKKVTYSILNTVLKDTFLTKKVTLDSIAALRGDIGTGSSIYANNGLHKDADSIKLFYADRASSLEGTFYYGNVEPTGTFKGNFNGRLNAQSFSTDNTGTLNNIAANFFNLAPSPGTPTGRYTNTSLSTMGVSLEAANTSGRTLAIRKGVGDSTLFEGAAFKSYSGGSLIYEMKSDGSIWPISIKKWSTPFNDTLVSVTELSVGARGFAIKRNDSYQNEIVENNGVQNRVINNQWGSQQYSIANNYYYQSYIGTNYSGAIGFKIDANTGTGLNFSGTGKHIRMTSSGTDTTEVFNQTSTGINQVFRKNSVTVYRLDGNGHILSAQISAALTDNTPTDAEIDTATGLTPSTAGAGYQVTIKDNNGTGLLYKVESDGTDWYCWGGACNGTKLL